MGVGHSLSFILFKEISSSRLQLRNYYTSYLKEPKDKGPSRYLPGESKHPVCNLLCEEYGSAHAIRAADFKMVCKMP